MDSLASMPRERQCHIQLFKLVYGSIQCPDCDGRLLFRRSYAWCKACRKKRSVRAATWFRGSNLPLQKLWLLIWCWQKQKGVGNTVDIAGVSYPTVQRWFRRFRALVPQSAVQLAGIVEVDESFFGRQKYGHQALVVGAIERDTRRVRLSVVPDRAQDTLEAFLTGCVARSSLICTDAFAGYHDLEFYGYAHERCNHSNGHFGPTNMIENFWGVLKRSLRRLYGRLTLTDLRLILREWEQRQNQPELFYTVTNYLRATICSGFVR
jgi:transposase-like protein